MLPAACLKALSIRLSSSSRSDQASAATQAGPPSAPSSSYPRSTPACSASGMRSASACGSHTARSSGSSGRMFSRGACARVSASNWVELRIARSVSWRMCCSACAVSCGRVLAWARCTCMLSPASGVRSWCAASATKRSCSAISCLRRPSRPSMAWVSGSTSIGMSGPDTGLRSRWLSSSRRTAGCSRRRPTRTPCQTSASSEQVSSSSVGNISIRISRARRWRSFRVSATEIVRRSLASHADGTIRLATRTGVPSAMRSSRSATRPSVAGASCAGIGCALWLITPWSRLRTSKNTRPSLLYSSRRRACSGSGRLAPASLTALARPSVSSFRSMSWTWLEYLSISR